MILPWGKIAGIGGKFLSRAARISAIGKVIGVHDATVISAIRGIRTTWDIGKRRTVAAGVLQTDGKAVIMRSASGPEKEGLLTKPENPVFRTQNTGRLKNFARDTDAEYKILEKAAEVLGAPSGQKGILTIQVGKTPCTSCGGVIDQFIARYPNVWVRIGVGE
jgi:putative deaminase of polymorphic toxin system